MLFYQTIDPSTLELLKKLLAVPLFKDMQLAGGTSLALQLGHRKSIDLDLFGLLTSDDNTFKEALASFEKVITLKKSPNINIFSINDVMVDFVIYSYPWIDEPNTEDGLRMAGLKDIAAIYFINHYKKPNLTLSFTST